MTLTDDGRLLVTLRRTNAVAVRSPSTAAIPQNSPPVTSAGSAIPLALALQHAWQYGVLAARRGVVSPLLGAGALGVILVLTGWPVS